MDLNSGKNTTIAKFKVNDEHYIYAITYWLEDESNILTIKVFDDDFIWTGTLSKELANIFIEDTEEPEDEYQRNLRTALSCTNEKFVIEFAKKTDTAKLTWKQIKAGEKVIHGYITLQKDELQSKDLLIDSLLTENTIYRRKVDHLSKGNKTIADELEKCKKELTRFLEMNESLEQTLYGKFINLLNTKKRRIQMLEENYAAICNSEK